MSIFKLRINKFAQKDIEKTIEYYNDKSEGLGDDFWQETKNKLEQIENSPLIFQKINDNTRKANLRKFPFAIFYIVKDVIINVFGVIHHSRSTEIWKNRETEQDSENS